MVAVWEDRMDRRDTVCALLALGIAPFSSVAQEPRRIYRIGYPSLAPLSANAHVIAAFEQGLRDHGYVLGRDVMVEYRTAEGNVERYPQVVQEILRGKPDVIITGANQNTTAVKAATQSIPIVMMLGSDVIGQGYVKSFAKPGGNITGLTREVGAGPVIKRMELLKETAPGISRLAVLNTPYNESEFRIPIAETAATLGLRLFWLNLADDLEGAFAAVVRERADAVLHLGDPRHFGRRSEIAALAAKHRLPTAYPSSEFVDAGGLMSYGANLPDLFRRAADYVDKILKGAKPADLPIEQPTKFELVINLHAAKALSIAIPQSILLRADRVIG
jgi:putative ABC transport system substrate-binding protein